MGKIGVKVWIYRGDVITEMTAAEAAQRAALDPPAAAPNPSAVAVASATPPPADSSNAVSLDEVRAELASQNEPASSANDASAEESKPETETS
jgi:hypothetical protein